MIVASALCALAFRDLPDPLWVVTDFLDQEHPSYGRMASEGLVGEVSRQNGFQVVGPEATRRAQERLGFAGPPRDKEEFQRLGAALKASVVLEGEVIATRVTAVSGGWQATVVLRVVAYDPFVGLPANGALVWGESTLRARRLSDSLLVQEAISQASVLAVRAMWARHIPTARVKDTCRRMVAIDRGVAEGFTVGAKVIFSRAHIRTAVGHVVGADELSAEIQPDGIVTAMSPGDRVEATYEPPLPPPGLSFGRSLRIADALSLYSARMGR